MYTTLDTKWLITETWNNNDRAACPNYRSTLQYRWVASLPPYNWWHPNELLRWLAKSRRSTAPIIHRRHHHHNQHTDLQKQPFNPLDTCATHTSASQIMIALSQEALQTWWPNGEYNNEKTRLEWPAIVWRQTPYRLIIVSIWASTPRATTKRSIVATTYLGAPYANLLVARAAPNRATDQDEIVNHVRVAFQWHNQAIVFGVEYFDSLKGTGPNVVVHNQQCRSWSFEWDRSLELTLNMTYTEKVWASKIGVAVSWNWGWSIWKISYRSRLSNL